MTKKKSKEEWYAKLDELVDASDTHLTENERESKWCLQKLIDDGYYDPYRVDLADVAGLMVLKNIISDDASALNFTLEDEKKLLKVLEDDWDNLDDYCRVVYHIINRTGDLPRWGRPYPATQDFMQRLTEFLRIDPKTTKFRTWSI
jgi:hypothetical protein